MVGKFIWNNSPDCISHKGDFQDIPMWREFNYQMLKYIHENYSGTIIVPMTLVDKEYYNQIINRLMTDEINIQHYILMADKPTILKRLKQRGESENSWVLPQIDRCLDSLQQDIMGIKIDTTELSIEEIIEFILNNS